MPRAQKKCILCKMTLDDPVKLGEFKTYKNISAHYYCLLLTTQLMQSGNDNQGILGFLPADIRKEEQRIRNQVCIHCLKPSANIACCAPKCYKVFHLYCGLEKQAICHFKDDYRTICARHHSSERRKCTKNDKCVICYESMGSYNRALSIIAPCCRSGWFHKWCIAKFALSAGYFFKCPLCNNRDVFRSKLVRKGIFVPDQDATWELEPNAFSDLLVRPESCSAETCKCPRGRSYRNYPYQLCTCNTCGSSAVHMHCMKQPSEIYNCTPCSEILNSSLAAAQPAPAEPPVVNQEPIVIEDEEVDVVSLDKDNKSWDETNFENENDNDNDSVDSLLLNFVRGKEEKDANRLECCSSTDLSGDSVLFNDRDLKVNYICNYHQSDLSDEDINLIYRSARKRKSSMRGADSMDLTVSPKRSKGSSSSIDSMLFDQLNKSYDIMDNEVDRKSDIEIISLDSVPIKTKVEEGVDVKYETKIKPIENVTPSIKSNSSTASESLSSFEYISSSGGSENLSIDSRGHKRGRKSSKRKRRSKSHRKSKEKIPEDINRTIVHEEEAKNHVRKSASPNESRPAPIANRRRSARLNPSLGRPHTPESATPGSVSPESMAGTVTPVSSRPEASSPDSFTTVSTTPISSPVIIRPSRPRSRARSVCAERPSRRASTADILNQTHEQPGRRLRAKSMCGDRSEKLRRSIRLRDKPVEKIYKEDLIYVTELEGGEFMKRRPFSEEEILHLFVKRDCCDNSIRQNKYDDLFCEDLGSSLKKRHRDISLDRCEEFSSTSSMVVHESSIIADQTLVLNHSPGPEPALSSRHSSEISSDDMLETFFEF